jgi:hypothetical protein
MIFFDFIFNIEMVENLTLYFFSFYFIFLCVCEFIEVTRVALIYRFDKVFLIELGFL